MKITSAKPDSTIISVKLDNETHGKLKKHVEENNITTSQYVSELIKNDLEKNLEEDITKTLTRKILIRGSDGKDIEVYPSLRLYPVKDAITREDAYGLAIKLFYKDKVLDLMLPYATLTVSFGEMIGMKNCTYVDANNCSFAREFLRPGIARDTGFRKKSGFCEYPLYAFNESFLISIGKDYYYKYLDRYNELMKDDDE